MDNNLRFRIQALDMFSASPMETTLIRSCSYSGRAIAMSKEPEASFYSDQFKISQYSKLMTADQPGAFIEIIYPSLSEMEAIILSLRPMSPGELVSKTMAADLFPLASVRGSAHQEIPFMMFSRFANAALSFAKLRVMVEAREGNVDAIDSLFAGMWGLEISQVKSLPHIHVQAGATEIEKISSLDDRPYPTLLDLHPYLRYLRDAGGFIINMADQVSPEAIGSNMPINWHRLLSAAEIFAFNLLQGGTVEYQKNDSVRIYLDVVEGSQPVYVRSNAWENLLLERLSEEDLMNKRKNSIIAEEACWGLYLAIAVINGYNRRRELLVKDQDEDDDDVYKDYDMLPLPNGRWS